MHRLGALQLVLGESGRAFVNDGLRHSGQTRAQGEGSEGGERGVERPLRVWDEDFVLKRQFAALIPAFDPRPGRTNVNQVRLAITVML